MSQKTLTELRAEYERARNAYRSALKDELAWLEDPVSGGKRNKDKKAKAHYKKYSEYDLEEKTKQVLYTLHKYLRATDKETSMEVGSIISKYFKYYGEIDHVYFYKVLNDAISIGFIECLNPQNTGFMFHHYFVTQKGIDYLEAMEYRNE